MLSALSTPLMMFLSACFMTFAVDDMLNPNNPSNYSDVLKQRRLNTCLEKGDQTDKGLGHQLSKVVLDDLVILGFNKQMLLSYDPNVISCTNTNLDERRISEQSSTEDPTSDSKYTALLFAAQHGRVELFDYLVEKGCNTSAIDSKDNNILHLASKFGQLQIVQSIIRAKLVDIDSKGYHGMTALLHSTYGGHIDVFRLLFNSACSMMAVDEKGDGILQLACLKCHLDIVKLILSNAIVDINNLGHSNTTGLMYAVKANCSAVFFLLIEHACDTTLVDIEHDNILHLASRFGHLHIVKYIIFNNIVDKNSNADNDMTPLLYATLEGRVAVFLYLIEAGCDKTAVNSDKEGILHLAAKRGFSGIVRHILQVPLVDIELRGKDGMTALLYAVKYDHRDVIHLLLNAGSNIEALTDDWCNILHIAVGTGDSGVVQHILTVPGVRDLMRKTNDDGNTPIDLALQKGITL